MAKAEVSFTIDVSKQVELVKEAVDLLNQAKAKLEELSKSNITAETK